VTAASTVAYATPTRTVHGAARAHWSTMDSREDR
jgi:hypothetical protein